MKRRVVFVRNGLAAIHQRFSSDERYDARLVSADGWFASLVTVTAGTLAFADGLGEREASSRFLLFLPRGALVRMRLRAADVETLGLTGGAAPAGWPTIPTAVPCPLDSIDRAPFPSLDENQATCFEALSRLIDSVASDQAAIERFRVDADRGLEPRLTTLRQRLFDEALSVSPVGRVGREAKMAPAVFSRVFTAAFGLGPRDYCQRVRIHTAVLALIRGVDIAAAAYDSGFGDLSRFYRQFRQATSETPGRYRTAGLMGRVDSVK
ncbi:MAG: helix-turn-helix domain-containing protein [Polyangiaceae bacterium]